MRKPRENPVLAAAVVVGLLVLCVFGVQWGARVAVERDVRTCATMMALARTGSDSLRVLTSEYRWCIVSPPEVRQ